MTYLVPPLERLFSSHNDTKSKCDCPNALQGRKPRGSVWTTLN